MLKFILFLLIYDIIGLIFAGLMVFRIIRKALKMGYSIDMILDAVQGVDEEYEFYLWGLITALFIWPIRILQNYKEVEDVMFTKLKEMNKDVEFLKAMKKLADKGSE